MCLSFLVPDLAKRPAKQWACLAAEVSLMDVGGGFCTSLAKVFYKGLSSLLLLPPPRCPCCVLFVQPCKTTQSPSPPGQGTDFEFIFNQGCSLWCILPSAPTNSCAVLMGMQCGCWKERGDINTVCLKQHWLKKLLI